MGLGLNCKTFRNTGTWGAPVWDEINTIDEQTLNGTMNEGAANTRRSPVNMSEPTSFNFEVTGRIAVTTDADYSALLLAYYTRAVVDIMVLDGGSTVNGSEGVRFEAKIHNWTRAEGRDDVLYRDYTFKPSLPSVVTQLPQSVLVTSGAPVFTTIV